MNEDDLKRYTVKVRNGSGCIFQPMDNDFTYILTAKHLFLETSEDDRGIEVKTMLNDGNSIEILRNVEKDGGWTEVPIPFDLQHNQNFFCHPEADITILKIDYLEGFENIVIDLNDKQIQGAKLCGFPESRTTNPAGDRNTFYETQLYVTPGHFGVTLQLPHIMNKKDIVGMSGGGFLRILKDQIFLYGVQSRMASGADHALGQVGMVPIKYFNEIIEQDQNEGKLARLLPYYLNSFSFFQDDLFSIKASLKHQTVKDRVTKLLKTKAKEIISSDITPTSIRDYLKKRMLMIEQNEGELQKKKIWSLWLEFLTFLNIAKEKSHCQADFPELFEQVRFFYSDAGDRFWIEHLHELPNMNYEGLKYKGTVVVATNEPSHDEPVLDISYIPENIAVIARDLSDQKEAEEGPNIDGSSHNPFQRYKFVDLSVFKEHLVKEEIQNDFVNDNYANCIKTLKELYEKFISYE
ncbi:ABC-three component system protein [Autumnicola musiva]|uniref:ABC-three component systems C-terminal domain-containing protein n=1 Tax=Autumnicola musiva TaxID=3075589 RepID=A0ABU3D731_9FLAO|nr:ABC-three component system protein [Zunongwangia sp. F117]MDT0677319.1 hypothetical protein [Zunongwangia sp. F117]